MLGSSESCSRGARQIPDGPENVVRGQYDTIRHGFMDGSDEGVAVGREHVVLFVKVAMPKLRMDKST